MRRKHQNRKCWFSLCYQVPQKGQQKLGAINSTPGLVQVLLLRLSTKLEGRLTLWEPHVQRCFGGTRFEDVAMTTESVDIRGEGYLVNVTDANRD